MLRQDKNRGFDVSSADMASSDLTQSATLGMARFAATTTRRGSVPHFALSRHKFHCQASNGPRSFDGSGDPCHFRMIAVDEMLYSSGAQSRDIPVHLAYPYVCK